MSVKPILMVAGAMIITCAALLAFDTWREANDAAVLSCVASVNQGLADLSASAGYKFPEVGGEWEVLDEPTGGRLISEATKTHPADCASVSPDGAGTDYWGNQLVVAVRRAAGSGELELRVWSKGRDGVSGTPDDLAIPRREEAVVSK